MSKFKLNWPGAAQPMEFSPYAHRIMDDTTAENYASQWDWGKFNGIGKEEGMFGEGEFFGKDGGFGSLMGFGKDAFNIYGGFQKLNMMNDMFDMQEKFAKTNLYNQGVMLDEGRAKQRATLSGNWAPGQAPNRSYLDNPEEIKRTV